MSILDSEFHNLRNEAEAICRIVEHFLWMRKNNRKKYEEIGELLDKIEERLKNIYEQGEEDTHETYTKNRSRLLAESR